MWIGTFLGASMKGFASSLMNNLSSRSNGVNYAGYISTKSPTLLMVFVAFITGFSVVASVPAAEVFPFPRIHEVHINIDKVKFLASR